MHARLGKDGDENRARSNANANAHGLTAAGKPSFGQQTAPSSAAAANSDGAPPTTSDLLPWLRPDVAASAGVDPRATVCHRATPYDADAGRCPTHDGMAAFTVVGHKGLTDADGRPVSHGTRPLLLSSSSTADDGSNPPGPPKSYACTCVRRSWNGPGGARHVFELRREADDSLVMAAAWYVPVTVIHPL